MSSFLCDAVILSDIELNKYIISKVEENVKIKAEEKRGAYSEEM